MEITLFARMLEMLPVANTQARKFHYTRHKHVSNFVLILAFEAYPSSEVANYFPIPPGGNACPMVDAG
jgi:hypothetical protein